MLSPAEQERAYLGEQKFAASFVLDGAQPTFHDWDMLASSKHMQKENFNLPLTDSLSLTTGKNK